MHFEFTRYTDSIRHYTDLALANFPAFGSDQLRARQYLCHAYVAYFDWSWIEVDVMAAAGIRLLTPAREEERLLTALLLNIQGSARQQRGSILRIDEDRLAEWERGLEALVEAYTLLGDRPSPWRSIIQENLQIALSRYAPGEDPTPEILTRLPPAPTERPGYVNVHRAPAKHQLLHGHPDTALYLFEQMIAKGPYFRQIITEEGFYGIRRESLLLGDYDKALASSRNMLDYFDCCTKEYAISEVSDCTQHVRCSFVVSEHAEIYLQRYLQEGTYTDLQRAYIYSQRSVKRYTDALATVSEESLFNRLTTLGERLIRRALTAAFHYHDYHRNAETLQSLLTILELGRTHMLSMDLQQEQQLSEERIANEVSLAGLKLKYAKHLKLSVPEINQFVRIVQAHSLHQRANVTDRSDRLSFSVEDIQRALRRDQCFIEFADSGDDVFAVYVDADSALAYKLDVPLRTLQNWVAEFTAACTDVNRISPVADTLFNAIFGPVYDERLRQRTSILLSPSVTLGLMPFAALPLPGKQLMVERYALRQVDSWRTFTLTGAARTPPIPSAKTVSVGSWVHPGLTNYFSVLTDKLQQDPQLRCRFYLGEESTSRSLLHDAIDFDWLQLAVHATGNPLKLYENHLYLSTTDSLNGRRIDHLPLTARLVVLAACSGGQGFTSGREGTFSLRRNFKQAGVPHVVSSLFDIPAAATAAILPEFYQHLLEGATAEDALARAQRKCRSGDLGGRWVAPVFWAGLIVS
ncbi:CHAT domain-containing protein [Lewinella sp. IMCC34191]|uniref:CHAT domain-containing protein n=1 Tax=Lewinella sp. IMCC34191 TaxID=2259172 RepID=UPI0013002436|nr:CHAT domain-containing protein [Lewinella sp. IMCC34191]